MNQTTLAIVAVVGVAVLALLLRRGSNVTDATGPRPSTPPPPDRPPADASEPALDESEGEDEGEDVGAFTSDGWAFVPDGAEVQIVPPAAEGDDLESAMDRFSSVIPVPDAEAAEGGRRHRTPMAGKPGEHLDAGDLIGARIVRGAPDTDPWRLEALGRQGEYRAWAFETEDAARTALNLLQRRVVRPPLDDHGEPSPLGDADYATAHALTQAGIAEVAMDPGDDEPAP